MPMSQVPPGLASRELDSAGILHWRGHQSSSKSTLFLGVGQVVIRECHGKIWVNVIYTPILLLLWESSMVWDPVMLRFKSMCAAVPGRTVGHAGCTTEYVSGRIMARENSFNQPTCELYEAMLRLVEPTQAFQDKTTSTLELFL